MEKSIAFKLFKALPDKTKAECSLCGNVLERTESLSTTTLLRHLKVTHKIEEINLNKLSWTCMEIPEEEESDLSKRKSNPFFLTQKSVSQKILLLMQ